MCPTMSVRILVGLIGVVVRAQRLACGPRRKAATQPTAARGVFWGAVAGFTSTMSQAGGPPFQVYVLPQRMAKLTLVGTNDHVLRGDQRAQGRALFRPRPVLEPTVSAPRRCCCRSRSPPIFSASGWCASPRPNCSTDRLLAGAGDLAGAAVAGTEAPRFRLSLAIANADSRRPATLFPPKLKTALACGKTARGRAMPTSPYDTDLDRNAANFQPLTPLGLLERAATLFPAHTAIIHGALRRSYADFYARARRLASALARRGVTRGDTVTVMLPNTPAMLEAHYGVPMTGAVLNALNTRLDAAILAFTFDHAETKILITDREFSKVVKEALGARQGEAAGHRLRRSRVHRAGRTARRARIRGVFCNEGDPDFAWAHARTTNGTRSRSTTPRAPPAIPRASSIITAAPTCWRSAMCSPAPWPSIRSICGRCRCSTATAGAFRGRSRSSPAPMCACAGCARRRSTTPSPDHKVTHLCGAPIVMSTLLNAAETEKKPLPHGSSSSPRRRRRPRRCSPR